MSKRSPDFFERFAYVRHVIAHFAADKQSDDYIHSAISHAFCDMPTRDFAKEIIHPHLQQCRVIPMEDVAVSPAGTNRSADHGFVKSNCGRSINTDSVYLP